MLRRQRQILQSAEKQNKMLSLFSVITESCHGRDLPKGYAQAPDGLHFVTGNPASTDPIAVDDVSAVLMKALLELVLQLRR